METASSPSPSEEQCQILEHTGTNKMFPCHRVEGSPASLQLTPHLAFLSRPSYVPSLSKEDLAPIHVRKNLNKGTNY